MQLSRARIRPSPLPNLQLNPRNASHPNQPIRPLDPPQPLAHPLTPSPPHPLTLLYLDHHATTPTDPRVAQLVYRTMTEDFGNASSTDHPYGDQAAAAVQQAAQQVANLVGCSPREILWTSGATESLNLALQGSLPLTSQTPTLHSFSQLLEANQSLLQT